MADWWKKNERVRTPIHKQFLINMINDNLPRKEWIHKDDMSEREYDAIINCYMYHPIFIREGESLLECKKRLAKVYSLCGQELFNELEAYALFKKDSADIEIGDIRQIV